MWEWAYYTLFCVVFLFHFFEFDKKCKFQYEMKVTTA